MLIWAYLNSFFWDLSSTRFICLYSSSLPPSCQSNQVLHTSAANRPFGHCHRPSLTACGGDWKQRFNQSWEAVVHTVLKYSNCMSTQSPETILELCFSKWCWAKHLGQTYNREYGQGGELPKVTALVQLVRVPVGTLLFWFLLNLLRNVWLNWDGNTNGDSNRLASKTLNRW